MQDVFVWSVHMCVCVCSIDQVSVVDVERAGRDKLNDAIAPHASVSFWLFPANFLDTY